MLVKQNCMWLGGAKIGDDFIDREAVEKMVETFKPADKFNSSGMKPLKMYIEDEHLFMEFEVEEGSLIEKMINEHMDSIKGISMSGCPIAKPAEKKENK